MGSFDTVHVQCPKCFEIVEDYQTKDGDCRLNDYATSFDSASFPLELITELCLKSFQCESCGIIFKFNFEPRISPAVCPNNFKPGVDYEDED